MQNKFDGRNENTKGISLHAKADLHEYLQSLRELYLREMLGDCFVDSHEIMFCQSNIKQTDLKKTDIARHSPNPIALKNFHINNTPLMQNEIDMYSKTFAKAMNCKLCSLSNAVKDNERFCGLLPSHFTFLGAHSQVKSNAFPRLGFIADILRFKQLDPQVSITHFEENAINNMLFDIIEKVFLLSKESVFIFSWFKCVEVAGNSNVSMQLHRQSIFPERHICKAYLLEQLEGLEYAVFFGEQTCNDLFNISLGEASGKLLEYYTQEGKRVLCVCVQDLPQIRVNPKYKKDAYINFVLLKNAIQANSSQSS